MMLKLLVGQGKIAKHKAVLIAVVKGQVKRTIFYPYSQRLRASGILPKMVIQTQKILLMEVKRKNGGYVLRDILMMLISEVEHVIRNVVVLIVVEEGYVRIITLNSYSQKLHHYGIL